MADYCTLAEVKAVIPDGGLSATTDYDAALSTLITAASRGIDQEVGRWDNFFASTDTTQTYYYDGNGETSLWIDEFASITSVSVSDNGKLASSDYTAWATSDNDYIVWPYNSTPTMRLDIDQWNGSQVYFPDYPKAVAIVGARGYSTSAPEIVNLACIEQVERWWMEAKQAFQESGADADMGQVVINNFARRVFGHQLHPNVANKLNKYKLANSGGAGYE